MALIVAGGRVMGHTFRAFQPEIVCGEYLCTGEVQRFLFQNSWFSALPSPGVEELFSRKTGYSMGLCRKNLCVLPEDRVLLGLYEYEGPLEYPEIFPRDVHVSWTLLRFRRPMVCSPPAERFLRLPRKVCFEALHSPPPGGIWMLGVAPGDGAVRLLPADFSGRPQEPGEEDLFPLSLVCARRDGYLPGRDWTSPGNPLGPGASRSYTFCWE